ncbi:MAG: hypothetical protein KDB45_04505 [Mycobacterium sp.]|nr:hypothetical protein [Mycobacterium sp.]
MTHTGVATGLIDTIDRIADRHRSERRCVTVVPTGIDTVCIELSERAVDYCGRCGQTLPPAGPVTWIDSRSGSHQGAYSQQHGCGEWNEPECVLIEIDLDDMADMADPEESVCERIAAAAAELDADVARETDSEVRRIRAGLISDLRDTLAQAADIAADADLAGDEKAEALDGLENGGGEEPGVYRDGGRWQAWAWHPRHRAEDANEAIIVTEADL